MEEMVAPHISNEKYGSSAESVGKKRGQIGPTMDFQGMALVSNGGGTEAPGSLNRQGPDAPLAHRRAGYPLSGCVPAEPESVSPATLEFSEKGERKKWHLVLACRKEGFITRNFSCGDKTRCTYKLSSITCNGTSLLFTKRPRW